MPEETPGKGLSPGKVIFPCRHFDQVKRVEKSPKAKQYFVACWNTRDINPCWDLRYTLKRAICAVALDMP